MYFTTKNISQNYLQAMNTTRAPTNINTVWITSVHITAERPPAIVNTAVMAKRIMMEMYRAAL